MPSPVAPTKVLLWAPDEAEERIATALQIVERLNVGATRWEAVFNATVGLLGAAGLQQAQPMPLALPRDLLPGR